MVALILLLFLGSATAYPAHYHSCTFNFTGGKRLNYPYCDPSLDLDTRLEDLLSRMKPTELAAALDTSNPAIERLGLPSMQGGESTHGVSSPCGKASGPNTTGCPTSFPTGTGLGATFDRQLWRDIGHAIGIEARGLNNQAISNHFFRAVPGIPTNGPTGLYFLDPNINLMRDPRWGRAQEVPGEDPTLTSEYATNLVQATQYGEEDPRFMMVASTIKHFSLYDFEGYIPRVDDGPLPSGYCDTKGGCERWNSDSIPPKADFIDYFLVPFKAAIQRAEPASIMCSYNAVYGKPTCANSVLNNALVRDQWNWKGFFVSDCTALELMQNVKWDSCPHPWPSEGGNCTPRAFSGGHNYTHAVGDTVKAAMKDGGIDYNCGALYKTNLASVVKKKMKHGGSGVTDDDVRKSAKRVYRTMFRLGMLDPPDDQYYINSVSEKDVDTQEHRDLALRAARESIVLLKNDANALPLGPSITKIAFIGPHANSTQSFLGNYHGSNILVNEWSPLASIRRKHPNLDVRYAPGAQICDFPYGKNPGFPNMPCTKAGPNKTMIREAVDVAKDGAQAVVLFLGSDQTTEAENFDRSSMLLAGNGSQAALLKEVIEGVNSDVPIIVVLVHGGPIAWDHDGVDGILDAFYPGELGGPAIVDVLLGEYAPSGKLPYTNYYENFTTRDIRNTNLTDDGGITHQYFDGPVIFPFGHGLSYTTFKFGSITATLPNNNQKGTVHGTYSVNVTNVGNVTSDLVVLGIISSPVLFSTQEKSLRVPKQRLFDFGRLNGVRPNETRQTSLVLDLEDVSFVDEITGARSIVPSQWTLRVGEAREIAVGMKTHRVIERNDWTQSL